MNKDYGLVLEGGGFRGCYTAGALKWLNDHDIHFSYTVSISAAAAYGFFYTAGDNEEGYRISVKGVRDKKVFGLGALLNEGTLLGCDFLRKEFLLPRYKEMLDKIRQSDREIEVGLFNMDKGELVYVGKNQLDEDGMYLRASCTLPISGRMTKIGEDRYLDGGIRTMISIERSLATGHKKNLVIVTKDKNYVRKPNPKILDWLISAVYHKFPKMLKTLDGRVETYYREMGFVYDGEKNGDALLIRPSKDTGVKRFSGTEEQLIDMYNLGYSDMEAQKEEIFAFLGISSNN